MEQANVWEISKEEAEHLRVALEHCVKVIAESNARSEQTHAEIARQQAETEASLKQLRKSVERLEGTTSFQNRYA